MNYTVQWHDEAANELAALWFNHPSQQSEITNAAAELTQRLRTNPSIEGESRLHDRRIGFAPPLGIIFHVVGSRVEILRVWMFE